MTMLLRLLSAEWLKLRRSPVLRTAWVLPVLFLVLDLAVFERPFLRIQTWTPDARQTYDGLQLKLVTSLWTGFFHPVLLALLPAFLFLHEHRHRMGRRLYTLPVPRRRIFLVKAIWLLGLVAGSLALVAVSLFLGRSLAAQVNPLLASPFPWWAITRALGWLWLGSLPLLVFYLWAAERINSLAVPIMLGLIGILLTIALSGQDLTQTWRRDLNPWVLPYACAQQALPGHSPQKAHAAAEMFQEEPNVLRLPDGRRIRTWQNIPDEVLFPPSAPTPPRILAMFSLAAALLLFSGGYTLSGRIRS